MPNKKITELPAAGALSGMEPIEVVQGGVNKQSTTQDIANLAAAGSTPYRGDYAGTTTMPTTGGTYTAGAPGAGNQWRLTDTLVIGGNVYQPGTVIMAAIDAPGQTLANWIFLQIQP